MAIEKPIGSEGSLLNLITGLMAPSPSERLSQQFQGVLGAPQQQIDVQTPYQMSPDELFPGEQQPQGLMSVSQQTQPATGLFAAVPQEQQPVLQAAGQMVMSENPVLQKQGLDTVNKLLQAQYDPSARGKGISFGPGKTIGVDEAGNTYFVTEKRNALTNQTEVAYAPIGKVTSPQPVGRVQIASEYGETAEQAQRRKAEEERTKQQTKINLQKANEAMGQYTNIMRQADLYNEAINIIDRSEGDIGTSAVARLFPTLRKSTAELESLGNRMALGLLSTVSLGALSNEELKMLQSTALPPLPPEELKQWLIRRRDAEQKYAALLLEAAQAYLSGESQAEFFDRKKKEAEAMKKSGGGQTQRQTPKVGESYNVGGFQVKRIE